jgi:hypothetical protein
MNVHVNRKAADVEIDETVVSFVTLCKEGDHPATTVNFAVAGSFIAHGKLSVAEKVDLILELLANRAVIFDWTVPQLAGLFGISPGNVYKALKGTKAHHPRKPADVLTRTWDAADPAARLEFAKRIGPDGLFDAAVAAVD